MGNKEIMFLFTLFCLPTFSFFFPLHNGVYPRRHSRHVALKSNSRYDYRKKKKKKKMTICMTEKGMKRDTFVFINS